MVEASDLGTGRRSPTRVEGDRVDIHQQRAHVDRQSGGVVGQPSRRSLVEVQAEAPSEIGAVGPAESVEHDPLAAFRIHQQTVPTLVGELVRPKRHDRQDPVPFESAQRDQERLTRLGIGPMKVLDDQCDGTPILQTVEMAEQHHRRRERSGLVRRHDPVDQIHRLISGELVGGDVTWW